MLRQIRNLLGCRKGQGLAEYGLLVAGIITLSIAAVAVYGHKTSDMWAIGASLLPGAHEDDLGAIKSGKLVETTGAGTAADPIAVDTSGILAGTGNQIDLGVTASDLAVE